MMLSGNAACRRAASPLATTPLAAYLSGDAAYIKAVGPLELRRSGVIPLSGKAASVSKAVIPLSGKAALET